MLLRRALTTNFGDDLSSEIVRLITGKNPKNVNQSFRNPQNETIYMAIGSIMGWADNNTEVWGAGFINNVGSIVAPPKKIHAVRGMLTRNILRIKGIECPQIYGDPALLMPRFYNPMLKKKYKLSIIPHHIDRVLIPKLKEQYPDAHFIDVTGGIYQFIDEVIQSEHVISSALHGLIIADAYDVSNQHKAFSNKVLGNGFKFRDYQTSRGHVNLDKLLEACPFRRKQ